MTAAVRSQRKKPYWKSDKGRVNANTWRRVTSEERRERMFTALGGVCEDCQDADTSRLVVRKRDGEPPVPVAELWVKVSKDLFNALLAENPQQHYVLLCNDCRGNRIRESHAHGSPQRARDCKCEACAAFTYERMALIRMQTKARRLTDQIRKLEEVEIPAQLQKLENMKKNAHMQVNAHAQIELRP